MSGSARAPLPRPVDNPLQKPFWDAAAHGALAFQRCDDCGNAFLPAREECPECLGAALKWETASGEATLVSWVVYYRAFSSAFEGRLPYVVALVELAEGPRLLTNLAVDDGSDLQISLPLRLHIDEEDGLYIPRFAPI